ncbi:SAM-dependent DNA methyltransferase [[Mycoplasma] falconis]|uniref:site-specific DNA-methyltransferase (adenine-specific) n=1 Tax=[Mycoplasma] falconis TaxID=92403 RepID=A0A501X9Z9_9BACT|nr:type I restriction-modification system subunit M [[Mycoplasma] falconis]TPE57375.1 SAM-dependent DNA methyltransferase [[Mycoplasma] falconis]
MSQLIDEKVLWGAAEKMRDKVDPSDYKNVVLGLVFLKYASDRYNVLANELKAKGWDGLSDKDDYFIAKNVLIVPKEAQWDYVASFSKSPEIGQKIDEAFELLENKNENLKGILPKTYSKSELDKVALGNLVDFFTEHLKMEDADGDFFGQIYEFYLGAFAKHIATKGGEFFTPKSVVELMVDILEPYKGKVYDPCCGSGGMFVQCSKFAKEHSGETGDISIYGQESNPGNWKMAKMNLAIRGIEANLGDRNGDSFTEDKHKGRQFDFILANPPYNIKDYWRESLEGDERWIFGKPNEKNANYAWLSLMYAKLNANGKAAILMPNGATTSSTGGDDKLRKAMVEAGAVEAIIALPDKLFANVSISVQCWILNKNKNNKNFLFVNASEMGTLISRKIRVLEKTDIDKILEIFKDYRNNKKVDIPGFAKSVDLSEIAEKDYSLNPGRFVGVDTSNEMTEEEIKIELKKLSEELLNLMVEGKELEEKVLEILKKEVN